MTMPISDCQRHLGYTGPYEQYPNPPRMDGNILVCPDGLRWRIEQGITVPDLLEVGDTIRTSYGTGPYLVVRITKHVTCCCPYSKISRTAICHDHWDGPTVKDFHIEVVDWSLLLIDSRAKMTKNGKLLGGSQYSYINELVAFDGKLLQRYENSQDEVIIENSVKVVKTFQIGLGI